jgi:hypothetical protein
MGLLLDILGSSFIGGILLLLVLKMNLFISSARFDSDNELRMQQNAKTLAEIMNNDFRKIGYKEPGTSILTADSKRFKFLGDLERPGQVGYGNIDTLEYYVTDSLTTGNSDEVVLVRVLNNKDSITGPSLGLVKLNFSYLDSLSSPTADLTKIRYIKTEFWVKPIDQVNNFITGKKDSVFTYWEFTIYPRNI